MKWCQREIYGVEPVRVVTLIVSVIVPALLSGFLLSCSKGEKATEEQSDILVTVKDSALRVRDVVMDIPAGIEPEDSARLFHAIVNAWIDDRLLETVAEENIEDMERIETLVADYRRKLITEAYKRKVRQTTPVKLNEDSIRRYYDRHTDELLLDGPLVKGLYIKVPAESARLADVRRWISSASPDAIDALEKYGLEEAVQYDYFIDKWIDFTTVTEHIPYRFYDAEAFLKSSPDFETSYNGFVYILHITDYIPGGEKMPFEYARRVISERLTDERLESYERRLIADLRKSAMKDGVLKTPGYDPLRHRVTLSSKQ